MNLLQLYLFALSVGWLFKYQFSNHTRFPKFLKRKPFTCMSCMSGWTSFMLGIFFYHWQGLFCLPVGLVLGMVAERLYDLLPIKLK